MLRGQLREAVRVARLWRRRAQEAEAEGRAEEAARQAAVGLVAALPRGVRLVPIADLSGEVPLAVRVVRGVALGLCAPIGLLTPLRWLWGPVVLGFIAAEVAGVVARARQEPRLWKPYTDARGQYRVRLDRCGEAEVLCRRGQESAWQSARDMVTLPEEDRVARLEQELCEARKACA